MILTDLTPGQRFAIAGQSYEVDYLPPSTHRLGLVDGKEVFADGAPRIAVLYEIGADGERISDGYRHTDTGREVSYKKAIISDTRFNPLFETDEDRARQREEDELL